MATRVKDDKGNICFVMAVGPEEVLVDVEDFKEAKQLGITYASIGHHAKKGRRHFKNFIRKYDQRQGVERLNREDRERAERKAEKEAYKQRQEEERLQMIEDAKCSSKWFQELSKNNLVAKLKKDKYGNQQLI